MRKPTPPKRIVAALWLGNASGRDLLSGIFRFARERKHWQITLLQLPNGFSPVLLDQIRKSGTDGIITSDHGNPTVMTLARETSAPLVAIRTPSADDCASANDGIAFVDCNDYQVGALAARHFLSLGNFSSYCYVQSINAVKVPENDRGRGFRETLAAAGRDCNALSKFRAPDGLNSRLRLLRWLEELPKPAAILCFYDQTAAVVLNACREGGIKVPEQVSVLGVDNDEAVCELTTPSLSSVQPDHENVGYRAAQRLDDLLQRKSGRKRKRIPGDIRVVERDTTRPTAPATNLVRRGLAYISANAVRGIGVPDVIAHLGVSRSLADLRFREFANQSIREAIENRRLEIAVQKLKGTAWPIGRITAACGYASLQAFEAAFRKRFGSSPRAFRERHR